MREAVPPQKTGKQNGTRPASSATDPIPADAKVIGTGRTGTAYRVASPEGPTTLKVVEWTGPTPKIELRRELERLSRATHEGLAAIRRVGERNGRLHVVRDWVEGPSLAAVLADRRVLPFAEAAPVLRSVAEAIGALHRSGFVHREVKPGHVIGVGHAAKLIDAGLPSLDRDYTPPEWSAHRISTSRSDLWQLGALTVHVLGGAPPRRGGRLPSSAPRALEGIVDALLSEDPRGRPFGVRPFLDVLRLLSGFDDVEEISGLVELDPKPVAKPPAVVAKPAPVVAKPPPWVAKPAPAVAKPLVVEETTPAPAVAKTAVAKVPPPALSFEEEELTPLRSLVPPPLPRRRQTQPAPETMEPWNDPEIPVGFGSVVAAWTDGARRVWHWIDGGAKKVAGLARPGSRRSAEP